MKRNSTCGLVIYTSFCFELDLALGKNTCLLMYKTARIVPIWWKIYRECLVVCSFSARCIEAFKTSPCKASTFWRNINKYVCSPISLHCYQCCQMVRKYDRSAVLTIKTWIGCCFDNMGGHFSLFAHQHANDVSEQSHSSFPCCQWLQYSFRTNLPGYICHWPLPCWLLFFPSEWIDLFQNYLNPLRQRATSEWYALAFFVLSGPSFVS